ncbi:MAG: hypothetical protein ACRENU_02695 [Gemmatimonadaceae bacterium]
MHATLVAAALLSAGALAAQEPVRSRADSIAKARQDSIALVRELERMRQDTTKPPMGPQQAPINARLLPDISAVGDLVGDFSPKGSTQEDASRFGVREVELAFQAAVDPYFRGDVFLGFNDVEGVHIEQAFLTTTALAGLEARLGRFLMPVSKINTTHRHDLHTVEYPWVHQIFFGPEGLKGTGGYASRIFAPFGFYQELIATVVDRIGEQPEDLVADEPPNEKLEGMGVSARWRNYWDLSEASNLEVSASGITGRIEQPSAAPLAGGANAFNARQTVYGADLTYRWRPLEQGLYKSFIAQVEFLGQVNEQIDNPLFAGPVRDASGAYAFARWQLTRRLYVSGRYDWVEDPFISDATLNAASGYLELFPSEFSKFMLGYERLMPGAPSGTPRPEATNRILLQASFALGPHKPHPF